MPPGVAYAELAHVGNPFFSPDVPDEPSNPPGSFLEGMLTLYVKFSKYQFIVPFGPITIRSNFLELMCTFLLQSCALWEMGQLYCEICATGLFYVSPAVLYVILCYVGPCCNLHRFYRTMINSHFGILTHFQNVFFIQINQTFVHLP